MKLSKKDIKLVERSIRHWKEDIEAGLINKRKMVIGTTRYPRYEDTGASVPCTADYCALCDTYARAGIARGDKGLFYIICLKCPYFKQYGVPCTHTYKGHWYKFVKNPNLRTCRGMIRALESILRKAY